MKEYSPLTILELQDLSDSIKRIFFYRVCGTGMGSAAILLKQAGFEVEGGDSLFYPPMSDELKREGVVSWNLNQVTPELLKKFDLIVVGNVVGGKTAEATMIKELGVPYTSFPAALGELVLKKCNMVGIAGTHGKTTTTYLATQIFEKCQKNPSYLIGGVMEDRASSLLADEEYFFIESDEYDSAFFHKRSKFHYYQLKSLILTSLEFDHADIYNNLQEIEDQFNQLLPTIQDTLIINAAYPSLKKMLQQISEKKSSQRIYAYGMLGEAPNGPRSIKTDLENKGTRFDLTFEDQTIPFHTNLFGEHNILNLSAVLIYALSKKLPIPMLQNAVKDLNMVKRRQEFKFQIGEWIFIDDFAHHPTAVRETLRSVMTKYPNRPLLTLLAPLSATARSSIFQKEFAESLEGSTQVFLMLPDKKTTAKMAQDLDCDLMAKDLLKMGVKKVEIVKEAKEAANLINQMSKHELGTVLVLSNGNMQDFWENLQKSK